MKVKNKIFLGIQLTIMIFTFIIFAFYIIVIYTDSIEKNHEFFKTAVTVFRYWTIEKTSVGSDEMTSLTAENIFPWQELPQELRAFNSMNFFIFDNNGKLLYSKNSVDSELLSKLINLDDQTFKTLKTGGGKIEAYSHKTQESTFAVTVLSSELFQRLYRMILISIYLFIISAIVSSTVAFMLSRRITKSIYMLINASRKIGCNQYEKISIGGKDEIKELADTFNSMTEEILKSTSDLEKAVQERTQEIQQKTQELEKLNNKLHMLSVTDDLTGLYNRRFFNNNIDPFFQTCQRNRLIFNIVIFDIDFFKQINDKFGHPNGDKCIKEISYILKKNFTQSNEFIARYGGEEFIVLNMGDSSESFFNHVENIRREIKNRAFCLNGQTVCVSVSAGLVSKIPGLNDSAQEFLSYADNVLYEAKENGRDRTLLLKTDRV
ncbi:MAG TPA: diguanylate cyclase [Petrotogaceae bacterium]|jgi:diguanylate cyclase (GGDEF)-like protein|nr:diguanylate cyclase [Petrotogaceae bacterium]HOG33518.1 diguanylate cyclase [Petrotogaceae bacterium]HOT31790.1 diguanylate cyclase [Petrotogaceae bacterium]HPX15191.1 diguanylate cyclase [Petrotogaceae bacterium]HQC40299.1 diguanylate cyclase [Petrotogaceae bacterium]